MSIHNPKRKRSVTCSMLLDGQDSDSVALEVSKIFPYFWFFTESSGIGRWESKEIIRPWAVGALWAFGAYGAVRAVEGCLNNRGI